MEFLATAECTKICSQTLAVSQTTRSVKAFLSLNPFAFTPYPSRGDSFKANCEDPMLGNSDSHLCWKIYGFISVKEFQTFVHSVGVYFLRNFKFNPLNAKLNPICHLLALLGAHHILHISRIRVNFREF